MSLYAASLKVLDGNLTVEDGVIRGTEAAVRAWLALLREQGKRVWLCPDGDACWGVPPDCPHKGKWRWQIDLGETP